MDQLTATPVTLTVPCLAEYVSVVRLTVLGLCGRVQLSYDEVEDLRLAVGEACATSVHRYTRAPVEDGTITVRGTVQEDGIILEIMDNIPLPPEPDNDDEMDLASDYDDQHFRVSLMKLLVDEVEIHAADGRGQVVRLCKYSLPSDES